MIRFFQELEFYLFNGLALLPEAKQDYYAQTRFIKKYDHAFWAEKNIRLLSAENKNEQDIAKKVDDKSFF